MSPHPLPGDPEPRRRSAKGLAARDLQRGMFKWFIWRDISYGRHARVGNRGDGRHGSCAPERPRADRPDRRRSHDPFVSLRGAPHMSGFDVIELANGSTPSADHVHLPVSSPGSEPRHDDGSTRRSGRCPPRAYSSRRRTRMRSGRSAACTVPGLLVRPKPLPARRADYRNQAPGPRGRDSKPQSVTFSLSSRHLGPARTVSQ